MKKTLFSLLRVFILMSIVLLFNKCTNDYHISGDSPVKENIPQSDASGYLTAVNEVVHLRPFDDQTKSASLAQVENLTLVHKANVSAPENDNPLSASCLYIKDNQSVIGYNVRGADFGGAFQIIKFKEESELVETVVTGLPVDVNDILLKDNIVYMACSDSQTGAALYTYNLTTSEFTRASILSKLLEGQTVSSANGLVLSGTQAMLSAGNTNGGLFWLSQATEGYDGLNYYGAPSASSIAIGPDGNHLALLVGGNEGEKASLVLTGTDGTYEKTITLSDEPITHQNVAIEDMYSGKTKVRFITDNLAIATLGSQGAVVVNLTTEEIKSSPSSMLHSGNTNSFAFDDKFVYYGNGADGLYLATFDTETPENMVTPRWVWDTQSSAPPGSVNDVASDGSKWVVVAKGLDGVHILKFVEDGCGCSF
ncbi:hypothetical protein [Prolixibacter sp. SD074]|uniref:hypothetical protein n=1 Tax=Prolixibacter sp. SD074 TaxID=2652391 RepID=UPI0012992A8B|nr:hypothetical protein [Prolixibacter sp. SD074]